MSSSTALTGELDGIDAKRLLIRHQAQADELKALGVKPFIRQDRPELYFADPDGITVQLADAEYRG